MKNIKIDISKYDELINKTILNIYDAQKTAQAFFDFLDANNYSVNCCSICFPGMGQIEISDSDRKNPTYDILCKKIKSFILDLADTQLQDAKLNAKYIFNYLCIVFYRGFAQTNNESVPDNLHCGMSAQQAHNYLYNGKDAIISAFCKFCIKHNITDFYTKNWQTNHTFDYLYSLQSYDFKDCKVDEFIKNMDDTSFRTIYSNFQNPNPLMDYRLCCQFFINILTKLKSEPIIKSFDDNKKNISLSDKYIIQLKQLIEQIPVLENMRDQKQVLSFYEFSNYEYATQMLQLVGLGLLHTLNVINLSQPSNYVLETSDISCFGHRGLIIGFQQKEFEKHCFEIDEDEDNQILDFEYFDNLFKQELETRNEKLFQSLKQSASQINNPEEYVMRFLKQGQMWQNSQNLNRDFVLSDEVLQHLCQKVKQNNDAYNILAGFQKRYEDFEFNGLQYDDYTYLLCGPIKLIEIMLKLELKQNYPNNAWKFDKIEGQWIRRNRLQQDERQIYKRCELGGAVISLKNAIIETGHQVPWFFISPNNPNNLDYNCKFYQEFVSRVRNGYFHTDFISNIETAKQLFEKVSYWFSQCLIAFNPY